MMITISMPIKIAQFGRLVHFVLMGRLSLSHLAAIHNDKGIPHADTLGPAPKIGPTMPLANGMIFFPPTLDDLEAIPVWTRGWNNTSLIPWQGFQDFTSYCLQVPPTNDPPEDGKLACPNVKTTLR